MRIKHVVLIALLALVVLPSCGHKNHGPTIGSITAAIASPTVNQADALSISITNTSTATFTIAWSSSPPASFSGQVDSATSSTVNFSASTAGSYVITVSVTDTGGSASLAQTTLVVTAT